MSGLVYGGDNIPATPYVASDTPQDGTDEQTDVLSEVEKGTFEVKFVDDGGENEAGDELDRSIRCLVTVSGSDGRRTSHMPSLSS